jgi:phosphoglycolate phosphatase-like HAD superfamily hydrolase
MRCYVFDLDGTLADLTHRLHYIQGETKDWRGFFAACGDDKVILPVASLLRHLRDGTTDGATNSYAIIIMSGRSSECREATERWLDDNYLPYTAVYMRQEGDHRPDFTLKQDLLSELLTDGYEPIMFFDDRDSVVNMWRSKGYTCAQVASGDF